MFHEHSLAPLTRFDILAAADDYSRLGALRLRDADGGLRPKRTVLDADGALALGKFSSITDARSIVE